MELPAGELTAGGNLGVGFGSSRLAVNIFADVDMFAAADADGGELAINGKGQGVITMAREFTPSSPWGRTSNMLPLSQE